MLLGAASFASTAVAQDAAIPSLSAHVTDSAALLTAEQRNALESVLVDYESKKGSQIAVLTVSSTAPEAIEQYGIRVAEAWKIGRKGIADGVIIIVAKDNPASLRRLRIEVGRGLEGAIPDADAKRIIDENIAPHFRQGDFYGGLVAGINRIEGLLEGEALPAPRAAHRQASSDLGGFGSIGFWFVLLVVVLPIVMRLFGSRRVGYAGGNRALNGSFGSFVTGAVLGGLTSRGGGFGGGGFGGGGGGGGGGFSGGGGDFGGGGASGNW